MGGARATGGPGAVPAPAMMRADNAWGLYMMRFPLEAAWLAVMSTDEGEAGANALVNLRRAAQTLIGLPAAGMSVLSAEQLQEIGKAQNLRVLVIMGSERLKLSDKVKAALAGYLRGGGFVIMDSGGDEFYRSAVNMLRTLLPEASFARMSRRHPVFRGSSMPFELVQGCPVVESFETTGPAQGFFIGDRLAVFVSRGNLAKAWGQPPARESREAYQMGMNLIAYALQTAPEVE